MARLHCSSSTPRLAPESPIIRRNSDSVRPWGKGLPCLRFQSHQIVTSTLSTQNPGKGKVKSIIQFKPFYIDFKSLWLRTHIFVDILVWCAGVFGRSGVSSKPETVGQAPQDLGDTLTPPRALPGPDAARGQIRRLKSHFSKTNSKEIFWHSIYYFHKITDSTALKMIMTMRLMLKLLPELHWVLMYTSQAQYSSVPAL